MAGPRVVIIERNLLFRRNLALYLQLLYADLQIVAEADSGETGLPQIVATQPDLALIDLDLPGVDGLGVARHVRHYYPSIAVIILGNYADHDRRQAALDAGASGYVDKADLGSALPASLAAAFSAKRDADPDVRSSSSFPPPSAELHQPQTEIS